MVSTSDIIFRNTLFNNPAHCHHESSRNHGNLARLALSIVVQQRIFRQINAMSALATYLAALSDRADRLLETHHQELFDLGLDVSFNRATLATKYWLPLPESDVPTHRTDAPEDEYPANEDDEHLFSELRDCDVNLHRFEEALERLNEKPFERSVGRLMKKPVETPVVSTLHNMYAVG